MEYLLLMVLITEYVMEEEDDTGDEDDKGWNCLWKHKKPRWLLDTFFKIICAVLIDMFCKENKTYKNSFSKKLDEKYKTKNTKFLHNFTWEKQAPPPLTK